MGRQGCAGAGKYGRALVPELGWAHSVSCFTEIQVTEEGLVWTSNDGD